MEDKPWGGRFRKETLGLVEDFTASVNFDKRLYKYDIIGSTAHCRMLFKVGLLNSQESKIITKALKEIEKEIEEGKFVPTNKLEDIHMNIEYRLSEKIGNTGGKLHTARSRNDQIALDIRLFLRDEIKEVIKLIDNVSLVLLTKAEKTLGIIMPGFTHLQHAQPILLSHHLMAYYNMFYRDRERFLDGYSRVNVLSLGAGALAGTSLPIDRKYLANILDFPEISENSVDTVSDRDFVIEFCSNSSILMMHLSRLSEEIVIWSSCEFDFIELSDEFCTGSSIMPQKKNPDVPELIRGKVGRTYGNLFAILTIMKSLPLSYNRDMQEDKEPLFDTLDTIKSSLKITEKMIEKIEFKSKKMQDAAELGFTTATDLVEYLVKKGLPFRESHHLIGRLVKSCIDKGISLSNLTLEDFKKISPLFEKDVLKVITIKYSVNSKKSLGSTSQELVKKAIISARKRPRKIP
jgi:argininosuccinate lyase